MMQLTTGKMFKINFKFNIIIFFLAKFAKIKCFYGEGVGVGEFSWCKGVKYQKTETNYHF